jgi:uncharacterized YccA/Bax inhibitor family protein
MAGWGRSSNPALKPSAFEGQIATGEVMTIQGTVNKTGVLLVFLVAAAAWTWGLAHSETPDAAYPWMMGGLVGGLVAAFVTIFKKDWSPLTAPVYAALEGLVLGGISAVFDKAYHGIALQAVGLTCGTLFVLLLAYKTGIVRATRGFKLGIVIATGGIAVLYLVEIVANMFFHFQMPYINSAGPIGIGFSLVVVIIAALNLIIDFDMIENGAQMGAPKYMEWYGAFGIMVTLVWLYLEILRLLGKMRSR